jgi:hypothetical protein
VVLDMRERLRRAQRAATEALDDPLAVIYVGTVRTVEFMAEHHRLYGLMTTVLASPVLAEAVAASSQAHAEDTASVLADGQARGLVRPDESPVTLAFGNSGVVNHAVLSHVTGSLGGDIAEVAHFTARYVVHAVATAPALVDAVIAAHGPSASA